MQVGHPQVPERSQDSALVCLALPPRSLKSLRNSHIPGIEGDGLDRTDWVGRAPRRQHPRPFEARDLNGAPPMGCLQRPPLPGHPQRLAKAPQALELLYLARFLVFIFSNFFAISLETAKMECCAFSEAGSPKSSYMSSGAML